jgi:imidazolonepropionase-like amidohydrolase
MKSQRESLDLPWRKLLMERPESGFTSRGHRAGDNGPFYVLAGWLIDGSGAAMRRQVLIKVEQGMIVSLEHDVHHGEEIPNLVNLGDCTVLPGLVDCHVHLNMSGANDRKLRERQLEAGFGEACATIGRHIEQQVAHGVVAVRDGGDYAAHTLRFKQEILGGSRFPCVVKSAGRAWRAAGRYGKLIGRAPEAGLTLADAITRREEQIDHVKVVNSGLNSLHQFARETAPQFSFEELRNAVVGARRYGLGIMVHANGTEPVKDALAAGCHSIEHGFFMGEENLELLADRQISWVPTAFTMKAYAGALPTGSREAQVAGKTLEHQLEQLRHARSLGVSVAVGTDSGSLGVDHGKAFREELGLLLAAGFSLVEAARCATANGARLLGLERELGSLRSGMPATFIATRGRPADLLEALAHPATIFVRGHLIAK